MIGPNVVIGPGCQVKEGRLVLYVDRGATEELRVAEKFSDKCE